MISPTPPAHRCVSLTRTARGSASRGARHRVCRSPTRNHVRRRDKVFDLTAPAGTILAVHERLTESDSATRGELEWLDKETWRRCFCVLQDGIVSCFAAGTPPDEAGDVDSDDDMDLTLEELALTVGGRGRSVVRLSLTRVALVGTDPQRGPNALRLVIENQGEHQARPFRAANRDEMIEWLFGFHRSLAIVVARIRGEKQHGVGAVRHKKSASRRRHNSVTVAELTDARPKQQRVPAASLSDDGAELYRKSSARPMRSRARIEEKRTPSSKKYVPPHLRRKQAVKQCDSFEETGDMDDLPPPPRPTADPELAWCAATPNSVRDGRTRHVLEWRSGARCEQGKRRQNEDACVDLSALASTDDATYGYFGVYDGHSGEDAVGRCAADLHGRVADALKEGRPPAEALEASFAAVDAEYCADAALERASLDAGATALALLLVAPADDATTPSLVVANCGDCAAVLSRKGVAKALTTPHTAIPGSTEAARIVAAGGWITTETDLCVGRLHAMDLDDPEISECAHERVRLNVIHRVCGEVAVTRAIGDVDFKGWGNGTKQAPAFAYPPGHPRKFTSDLLVATPDLVHHELRRDDDFVVLATDGLWDVVDPQEAVTVAASLFAQNRTPRVVADKLVERALRLGSGDNVTVLVLQLRFADPPADRPPPRLTTALTM